MANLLNLHRFHKQNRKQTTTYHKDDVAVSLTGRQMESGVVTHVCGVDASTAANQHVHNAGPAFASRPVQQAKSVVIAATQTVEQCVRKHNKTDQNSSRVYI